MLLLVTIATNNLFILNFTFQIQKLENLKVKTHLIPVRYLCRYLYLQKMRLR